MHLLIKILNVNTSRDVCLPCLDSACDSSGISSIVSLHYNIRLYTLNATVARIVVAVEIVL